MLGLENILILTVVLGAMVLFVTEILRVDLVALCVLVEKACETEPELRRMAHELPDWVHRAEHERVNRLRALGNAVVPKQAEKAFIELWTKMEQNV